MLRQGQPARRRAWPFAEGSEATAPPRARRAPRLRGMGLQIEALADDRGADQMLRQGQPARRRAWPFAEGDEAAAPPRGRGALRLRGMGFQIEAPADGRGADRMLRQGQPARRRAWPFAEGDEAAAPPRGRRGATTSRDATRSKRRPMIEEPAGR